MLNWNFFSKFAKHLGLTQNLTDSINHRNSVQWWILQYPINLIAYPSSLVQMDFHSQFSMNFTIPYLLEKFMLP